MTFSLPADLIVRLDEAAAADDRSRSAFVRRVLERSFQLGDAPGSSQPGLQAPANPSGACSHARASDGNGRSDRAGENLAAAERRLQDIRDRCARGPVVGLDR